MKITQLRNRNYVRCSVLDSARRIATRIPSRDFVPWRFSDAGCPSVWMASLSRRPRNLHIRRQRTAKERNASRRATYAQFANLIMSFRVRITLPPTTGALTKL